MKADGVAVAAAVAYYPTIYSLFSLSSSSPCFTECDEVVAAAAEKLIDEVKWKLCYIAAAAAVSLVRLAERVILCYC